jgi:hypothetical protein
MKIISWHPEADEIMENCIREYDPNYIKLTHREIEMRDMIRRELIDFIYSLNSVGLNVMIPKDFSDNIFVDTRYFTQR